LIYLYGDATVDMLSDPPPEVGVDTETPSISDRRLMGVGLGYSATSAIYVTPEEGAFEQVVRIIQPNSIRKIYHNAPFDLRTERLLGPDLDNIDDTAVMARLAMEPSAVLEDVSWWIKYEELGDRQTERATVIFDKYGVHSMDKIPAEVVAEKCCKDAIATLLLKWKYQEEIDMVYYDKQRRLVGILERISRRGIKLDQEVLEQLNNYYTKEVGYYRQLAKGYGFSPSSPQQVGFTLAMRGNFLPLKKPWRQYKTGNEVLRPMADPLAQLVILYRHDADMLSRYVRPLLGKDRAYTNLRMEAITGRLNSTGDRSKGTGQTGLYHDEYTWEDNEDRNLQNVPKNAEVSAAVKHRQVKVPPIRSAFLPDSGVFTKVDKSQVELRILAHISGDKRMNAVFLADGDLHEDTRQGLGVSRGLAKIFNYAVSYGADDRVVAAGIETDNMAMVRKMMEDWDATYPEAAQWFKDSEQFGWDHGYVETLGGRKIRIPWDQGADFTGPDGRPKHGKNCCRNYPIQGSAAEDIYEFMLHPDVIKYIEITCLQVHDEEIFDGDVDFSGQEYNALESAKEGHPVYDVKGELAWLSGFYAPMKVEKVERWG
jgi:DNA polymerase-1